MTAKRVNYDAVAPTYNHRYALGSPEGISTLLRKVASECSGCHLLEVGCGTGHWLSLLSQEVLQAVGLDLSHGMLGQAKFRDNTLLVARGRAEKLPFRDASFDIVICINALHHFDQPEAFIAETSRVLTTRGTLVVIGMDPQAGRDRWYLYDYFLGTKEMDLGRYPSTVRIAEWMGSAGFPTVEIGVAERILALQKGKEVFEDPILSKTGTSQLALLSDEAYAAGVERIRARLAEDEARGETTVFPVDIWLPFTIGRKRTP